MPLVGTTIRSASKRVLPTDVFSWSGPRRAAGLGNAPTIFCDGGHVEIAAHLLYELDPNGRQLRVVRFSEYAAEKVRTFYPSAAALRKQWADPMLVPRITRLEERGIDFDQLRSTSNQPEADPFDLLCHLAFNGPLRTRRERADR